MHKILIMQYPGDMHHPGTSRACDMLVSCVQRRSDTAQHHQSMQQPRPIMNWWTACSGMATQPWSCPPCCCSSMSSPCAPSSDRFSARLLCGIKGMWEVVANTSRLERIMWETDIIQLHLHQCIMIRPCCQCFSAAPKCMQGATDSPR